MSLHTSVNMIKICVYYCNYNVLLLTNFYMYIHLYILLRKYTAELYELYMHTKYRAFYNNRTIL